MLHFEVQSKIGERSDDPRSHTRPYQYPCFLLVFNHNWDDGGYFTWFSLFYYPDEITANRKFLGELKLLCDEEKNTFEQLPSSFDGELNNRFCAAWMSSDYYRTLYDGLKDTPDILNELLKCLHDCGTNRLVYERFSSKDSFKYAIKGEMMIDKAIQLAPSIISGLPPEKFYVLNYHYAPEFAPENDAVLSIKFNYNPEPYLRTAAIIGENGVQKTIMLSSFVKHLIKGSRQSFNNFPLYSSCIVVHSTKLDKYPSEDTETIIPYFPCCLEQDIEGLKERLLSGIIEIQKRPTVNNVWMLDLYRELINEHVGEISEGIFNDVSYNGQDIETAFLEDEFRRVIQLMSSGQLHLFSLITFICANVHLSSIFVIDEPEVHLHPHTIMNFMTMLCDIMDRFESYAIIATHSPLVVREVVKNNVMIMRKLDNGHPVIETVPFDTFGEDVTTLYRKIFGYDEKNSFFRNILLKYINAGKDYDEICSELSRYMPLNLNAKITIRDMILEKGN